MGIRPQDLNDVSRRYMGAFEAAQYLGTTRTALYHLTARHAIPFTRVGRRIVFDRVALDEFLGRPPVQNEGAAKTIGTGRKGGTL